MKPNNFQFEKVCFTETMQFNLPFAHYSINYLHLHKAKFIYLYLLSLLFNIIIIIIIIIIILLAPSCH